jgi:hypothetical protein
MQSTANRYAGLDVLANGGSWNWFIDSTNHSYNYQAQQGVASAGASVSSGGVFTQVGDFDFLSDTTSSPYTFAGLNAEISGGVAIFEQAFGGFPTGPLSIGVVQEQVGCLAPDGDMAINFLVIPGNPQALPYHASTDALYGNAKLNFQNGTFDYTSVAQFASGGASASTQMIPFSNSYCVQADAGYGIQSGVTKLANGASESELTYLGDTGQLVSEVYVTPANGGLTSGIGVLALVEPSTAIDLSQVTAGSYRGVYSARSAASQYADPAYFGTKSSFVGSPIFPQTGTSLVGGYEDFFTLLFTNPAPAVPGNVLLDFGTQDASHNGLFPAATLKEQDPSNHCSSSQQSIGPDGLTYCTFPVTVLVGQSYGKFVIYIAGPEPTAGNALFYALVQD